MSAQFEPPVRLKRGTGMSPDVSLVNGSIERGKPLKRFTCTPPRQHRTEVRC
jgi:hypothetical protein